MKVHVIYMAQAKKITGITNEAYELSSTCKTHDFIKHVVCQRHAKLADCILGKANNLLNIVAIFVGETKIEPACDIMLQDGDEITIMPPIAGG